MSDFDKILKRADDSSIELTAEIKELLGTELQFGMSDYVCKNGTLSDGFEKITPAQRYYQAVKECWTYGSALQQDKAMALQLQTKLKISNILNALFGWMPVIGFYFRGKAMSAAQLMASTLMGIEDKTRILGAFNDSRKALLPVVRSKYKSIEDAEPDNWAAVLKFRIMRQKIGKQEFLNHVPGNMYEKAKMGLECGAPEAVLWLAVEKEKEINECAGGNIVKYLDVLGYSPELPDPNVTNLARK